MSASGPGGLSWGEHRSHVVLQSGCPAPSAQLGVHGWAPRCWLRLRPNPGFERARRELSVQVELEALA